MICSFEIPAVESEIARNAITEVRAALNAACKAISNGVEDTAMVAWQTQFSEEDRWHLVNFVRTLADAGGAGMAAMPDDQHTHDEGEHVEGEASDDHAEEGKAAAGDESDEAAEGHEDMDEEPMAGDDDPAADEHAEEGDEMAGDMHEEAAEGHEDMAAMHGIPPEAAAVENLVETDESSVARGAELFQVNCVVCHGPNGAGDGPAAGGLEPKPANLSEGHVQENSDGSLFYIISEGSAGTAMPSWKTNIGEEDRWHLVNFLRTLPGSE